MCPIFAQNLGRALRLMTAVHDDMALPHSIHAVTQRARAVQNDAALGARGAARKARKECRLFAGLRIGSTLAVVGVVVGELVGGNMGLGYLLSFGEGQANTAMVFVSIVMLTLVGGVAYLLVILIEQRVLHYLPKRAQMGF